MTFTLKITLGDDAMQTPEDVAVALRSTARRVTGYDSLSSAAGGGIWDENGNKVGDWKVTGRK